MFPPEIVENSRPDRIGVMERSGEDQPRDPQSFVLRQRTHLASSPMAAERVVLVDPAGAWVRGSPRIGVALHG